MKAHPVRFRVEAAVAAFFGAILPRLPRRLALALGRTLGRAWAALDPRHVRIAEDALRLSFPDWPEERVASTARAVYRHFAAVLFDILWMAGRPVAEILALVDVEGLEHVRTADAAGRGALLVSGHYGNWEAHGVAHAHLARPMGVIARPLDNPALDRRLGAIRALSGNTVIPKQRALGAVMKALRAGGSVAVLMDQNVQSEDGIFVEFFGRPAATTTMAAALARKTGCALIPSYTVLQPDGRYRLVYEPAILADPAAERDAELRRLTQAVTTRIESWIRAHPEQWLWLHRRWKTQPR
jgi:KDO2-lipid IV(A) lauroyltransferase